MDPRKPKEVVISAGGARLKAIFALPLQAKGVVAFAHGSGSGRLSPRNHFVAQVLQEAGIATLLADLLEEDEGFSSILFPATRRRRNEQARADVRGIQFRKPQLRKDGRVTSIHEQGSLFEGGYRNEYVYYTQPFFAGSF